MYYTVWNPNISSHTVFLVAHHSMTLSTGQLGLITTCTPDHLQNGVTLVQGCTCTDMTLEWRVKGGDRHVGLEGHTHMKTRYSVMHHPQLIRGFRAWPQTLLKQQGYSPKVFPLLWSNMTRLTYTTFDFCDTFFSPKSRGKQLADLKPGHRWRRKAARGLHVLWANWFYPPKNWELRYTSP